MIPRSDILATFVSFFFIPLWLLVVVLQTIPIDILDLIVFVYNSCDNIANIAILLVFTQSVSLSHVNTLVIIVL